MNFLILCLIFYNVFKYVCILRESIDILNYSVIIMKMIDKIHSHFMRIQIAKYFKFIRRRDCFLCLTL